MKRLAFTLPVLISMLLFFNFNPLCIQAEENNMLVEFATKGPGDLERMIANNDAGLRSYIASATLPKIKSDNAGGTIKKGLEKSKSQIKSLQTILNGLKGNSNKQAREYIYNELLKVNYKKLTGFMGKATLDAIFKDHKDPDPKLNEKVKQLRKRLE